MTTRRLEYVRIALLCLIVAACAEPGEASFRPACEQGLADGFTALGRAEARGLKGSANWTRAASLLGAARVQKEFGEYENCALKVQSAQSYLRPLTAE